MKIFKLKENKKIVIIIINKMIKYKIQRVLIQNKILKKK